MKESPTHLEELYGCVAGFTLCGWRQVDGRIRLGGDKNRGKIISAFPKEISTPAGIYTLEEVAEGGKPGGDGLEAGFINAEYV